MQNFKHSLMNKNFITDFRLIGEKFSEKYLSLV